MHIRNTIEAKKIQCTTHNNNARIQHPTLIMGTETEQGNSKTGIDYEPIGINKYLQNISS